MGPPATAQTDQLYDNLNGMQYTDRDSFSNLNLMQYYGGMPVGQLNNLITSQDKVRNNDPTEAARHSSLQSSISAVNDLTSLAAASTESPFYKMDRSSPFPPDQQKWNGFVSRFGQAMDDRRQNNDEKIPTDMQKREIARGILFPNGPTSVGAQPPQAAMSTFHDWDAAPAQASSSPEAVAINNPPQQDTNTGRNINTDTNVVNSNGTGSGGRTRHED